MSKLVSTMYKAARRANDLETLASGNPKRIARRGANKSLVKLFSKLLLGR